MTDEVELIHRRIEEIKANTKDKQFASPYNTGRVDLCNELLSFIDSLQEEPVSEDLEEFALQYAGHHAPYDSCMQEVEDAVKAGAKWQKEKDLKWLADNHKQIFNNGWADGYEDGRDSMEEDMTKDAVDAKCFGFQSGEALFSIKLPADKYLVGSEIKVVIIRED